MKPQIIFFIILIVVGFISIIFGLYNIFYYRNLKKAKGKIVDVDMRKFPELVSGKPTLYPVIEFIDSNKKKIRFVSKTGWSASNPYKIDYSKRIGEEINILYNQKNPKNAVIEKDLIWLKISPLVGGAIAVIGGIFGVIRFY